MDPWIEHTGDGTLVHDTDRDDTQLRQALKAAGFRWGRSIGAWYLPRNWTFAVRGQRVRQLVASLEQAGRTIDVQERRERERTSAEIEADRVARAEARAERMTDRADAAETRSEALRAESRRMAEHIPPGQPLLVDHHSLLANGPWGWIQIANLILTGLMAGAAAAGFVRAMRPRRTAGTSIGIYGVSLVLGGIFVADPMDGFPPGTADGAPESVSFSGMMHLAAGAIGFVALAVAYVALGKWFRERGSVSLARASRLSAAVIVVGFIGGAATSTTPAGVLVLWVAVLTSLGWLVVASIATYRTVPHPDRSQPR